MTPMTPTTPTTPANLVTRALPAILLLAAACTDPMTGSSSAELSGPERREGRRLFNLETFGGNGRTCRTCHSVANGTLTLDQIAARFDDDPTGPLFRGDGTDDGAGPRHQPDPGRRHHPGVGAAARRASPWPVTRARPRSPCAAASRRR
jgi:hypothetical protein